MDKARFSMSSTKLRKVLPNNDVLGVPWLDSMVLAINRQLDRDAAPRSPERVLNLAEDPSNELNVDIKFQAQPP